MIKKLVFLLFTFSAYFPIYSQMIFSENLTMKIDSTKKIQGFFSSHIGFQNGKKECLYLKEYSKYQFIDK